MNEKFLSRNVKRETEEHYGGGWPISADARRYLYLNYAKYPDELRSHNEKGYESVDKPRDMWNEIAHTVLEQVGNRKELKGIDVGSSSGYFIEKLYEAGYAGSILGVDIEPGHQPALEYILKEKKPGIDLKLGRSDAQSLRQVVFEDKFEGTEPTIKKVEANSFDFLTELFVIYHVPSPDMAYRAAHRVLKPDGLAIFSGRGRMNQQHLWTIGAITANEFSATVPISFYEHHSLDDMENSLKNSNKFELLSVVPQADHIWVPATDEGWLSYRAAIMSLYPMMKSRTTGKELDAGEVGHFLDEEVRPNIFDNQAEKNGGYFVDYVFQNYYVCRAIK